MRKEHKSPTGGLTAAGRAHFKRTEALILSQQLARELIPDVFLSLQGLLE